MKLHPLWLPSQKGLFFDWPQRQRATEGFSAGMGNWFPAGSMTVMGPWTRRGPLSRMVMVVMGRAGFACLLGTNTGRHGLPYLVQIVRTNADIDDAAGLNDVEPLGSRCLDQLIAIAARIEPEL